MKGMIVGVGANGRRGWLTTERAESSYGLPVFLFATDQYEPIEPAMSADELTAALGGAAHELAYAGWAEWVDGRLIECESEPSSAIEAGFQFGPSAQD